MLNTGSHVSGILLSTYASREKGYVDGARPQSAANPRSTVDLSDYIRVLRKRWKLITLCTLLALGGAAAATIAATPIYSAQAQLFVSTSQSASDAPSGLNQGGQFAQQRVKSYADVIDSPQVTEPVIERLGLDLTPRELEKKISADAPLDTVLINVSAEDTSPQIAQEIANAAAERFTNVAAALETPASGGPSPVKVSVVRYADLPQDPVRPRTKLNIALGLLVGLALGVGGAVLRETLDTSVKSVEDVQTTLDLPTLGVIGFDPRTPKHPLVVQDKPDSPRAEAFRQLRTNLQFVDIDHAPRSIVVTSSMPEEGKSTTTCNLAIALAQAGLSVILVEGDLRRPRLGEYLGVQSAIGVTDVLIGRTALDDVLQPWGDGTLQVLASGPIPPNPSELLGSHQMQQLIADLENRSDLVLIDAPPLLPVTDAAVLSKVTSGAILVVRSGRTSREQVARALETLQNVDAHVFGVVLNMAPTKGPDAYRYGYGGYGGYAARTKGRKRGKTPALTTAEAAITPARRPSQPSADDGSVATTAMHQPGPESVDAVARVECSEAQAYAADPDPAAPALGTNGAGSEHMQAWWPRNALRGSRGRGQA
jgi:succinoglycan biosynthesis transport protein ExoP